MSKLTLEIPDALHRTVKSFASAHGETIKDFFIAAATEKLQKNSTLKTKKPLKTVKKTTKKSQKFITEAQADKMLKPYLLRMVKRIEKGEEELLSWEDVKKGLKKS